MTPFFSLAAEPDCIYKLEWLAGVGEMGIITKQQFWFEQKSLLRRQRVQCQDR